MQQAPRPQPPHPHANLQTTNHMTSFGIIPLLKCFFKNATVVKLCSKGKFFFHVYLSHLVDLLIKNYVRSSGGCRGGTFTPNWGLKGRKKIFETGRPPYLRVWMSGPPSYLKVWIRHWEVDFEAYPCVLCHDVSQRDTTLRIACILDLISRSLQFVSYWINFFHWQTSYRRLKNQHS